MLVAKVLRNYSFFSTLRKVGSGYVPELPTYQVNPEAMRPYGPNEDGIDRDQYYKMIGTHNNI